MLQQSQSETQFSYQQGCSVDEIDLNITQTQIR